jgi:hypothetical protein
MVAMLVLVGSMAVAAQAQGNGRSELRANIPFAFNIGETTLPAGEYNIRQINPSSDRVVLQLRSRDGRSAVMIQMNSTTGESNESARLVFNRYGNQYFFSQAWASSDTSGLAASKSKHEKWAERETGNMKPGVESIALSR